jgi:hypothetical protein
MHPGLLKHQYQKKKKTSLEWSFLAYFLSLLKEVIGQGCRVAGVAKVTVATMRG